MAATMMNVKSKTVDITVAYCDYVPPIDVERVVRRLLDRTPPEYLAGLHTIVLTNSGSLNRQRRRAYGAKSRIRKRLLVREANGLYHQKWKGEPAWIEIFVDNLLQSCPGWLLRIPLTRDLIVGDTLFHEIGHHIHYTKAPEHKDKEIVADKWGKRLSGMYLRRQYWYLLPLLFPLSRLAKWIKLIMLRLN